MESHEIGNLHFRPGKVMKIIKICLGHGKFMEFQIFPIVIFSS